MSKFTDVINTPWEYKTDPFRLIGDIYYVGDKHVAAYLLETDKGLVLLDTALPQTLYQLWDSIYTLGFALRDIGHIFHTHAHYDHIGGTRALKEVSGARTYMGKEDVEILESRRELIAQDFYECRFVEYFAVDEAIAGGEVYDFGNIALECVHTPGHTPGTITYFLHFEDCGEKRVAALFGGYGTNTLTDEYLGKYNLDGGMRVAYKESLQILMQRKVDVLLGSHPGHNDTFGKAAGLASGKNPFVAAEEWPVFLSDRMSAINKLVC